MSIRLGHRQRQLLKSIQADPHFSHYLHNASTYRMLTALIKKGLLDQWWQITTAGKEYLDHERQDQQNTLG
jgi:hypothetical protein